MKTPRIITKLASAPIRQIIDKLLADGDAYWQEDHRGGDWNTVLILEDTGQGVVIVYGSDDFEINDEYFTTKGFKG